MTREAAANDVTVLRSDLSLSAGRSAEGAGEADAPRVLKQRFVLEEKLGSGGMGTAFRAKDLRKVEARDRQPYLAIKVLNNDFRDHPEAFIALQRETAKSQTLSHRNIVSIYDFDKDGDVPFMTMELLEGQELAQLLRVYPNGLPEGMAWSVIRGICAGLGHAHEAGIVHADFKPGNVHVAPNNTAKILDFGIARAVQLTEAEGDDTLFDPAHLAALTPAYASREMLAGEPPEPRDDLYSLGVVIYLILSGRHPYERHSAEDAAAEGLRPEKLKALSHRQWQVVQRCLAFDREDRPQSVAEVEKYLLAPSPWPSRAVLAVASVLLLGLSVNYLMDAASLSEVREEVRQSTLLDAQLGRLGVLLESPEFDEGWEARVRAEFAALRALPDSREQQAAMGEQIRAAYTQRILADSNIDRALGLLARGEWFGRLPQAALQLEQQAFARVRLLLDDPGLDESWMADLKRELARVHDGFPDSRSLAELDLEVNDTLVQLVRDAIAGEYIEEAKLLLSELSPRLFDALVLNELQLALKDADVRDAALRQAREIARAQRTRAAELDEVLSASCLRLDLVRIEALADSIAARNKAAARFNGCLVQLVELDPDRALRLERDISRQFGAAITVADVGVDPCGLSYLVGNGARSGRQGYCADAFPGTDQGPRLVVLAKADGSGRFAMTKQEISWAQFRAFCVEQEGCSREALESLEMDERMPVTGISLDTARDYARWLSQLTGHTYRLPTRAEWMLAAGIEPDPNRNCRVQLDGVERGVSAIAADSGASNEFGLKNMLGNIQEWVLDGEKIMAVGGAYNDPIGSCLAETARAHDGSPAADTGFRLVREVS